MFKQLAILITLTLMLALPTLAATDKLYVKGDMVGKNVMKDFNYATLKVSPERSQSITGVQEHTISLTNKHANDLYYFFDAYTNDAVDNFNIATLKPSVTFVTMQKHACDGFYKNGTANCTTYYEQEPRTEWVLDKVFSDQKQSWGQSYHEHTTQGILVQSGATKKLRVSYTTPKSSGKWNARVWATPSDDWSVITREGEAVLDYVIDPTWTQNVTGVLAYYTMDDFKTVGNQTLDSHFESTGNGYGNLTLIDSPSLRPGQINQSMFFNRSNNLESNDQNIQLMNTSSFSIALWVNTSNPSANFQIFEFNDGSGIEATLQIRDGSGDKLRFKWDDNSGTSNLDTDGAFPFLRYVHVCATINSSTAKIYIDGDLNVTDGTMGATPIGNTAAVILAAHASVGANNFKGNLDEVGLWNRTLSSDECAFLASTPTNSSQQYPFGAGSGPSPPPGAFFNLTAQDQYTGATITNFSALVNGTNYFTSNGVINTSIPINATQLINITYYNATNYFNRTYLNVNVSTNHTGVLHQAELHVQAYNAITGSLITNFGANTSLLDKTTTTGLVDFNLTVGTHPISFNSTGFQPLHTSFTLSGLQNLSANVSLIPTLNFTVYNESNGLLINKSVFDDLTMYVYCANSTEEHDISTNPILINTTGCQWDFMRLVVEQNNETYFRDLIPEYSDTTIEWYVIDLDSETAVEKTFILRDLAQDFQNGTMTIKKIIGTNEVTINKAEWDIENKILAYLILNDQYIVSLTDNLNTTRTLGNFLADSASTVTITVPEIPFLPTTGVDGFNWGYLFNQPDGWLYMFYNSTVGLNSVNWLIVNASNESQIFLNTTLATLTGTVNYTGIQNESAYKTYLTFDHDDYSTHVDTSVWGSLLEAFQQLEGFADEVGFKKWFSVITLTVTALLFSGLSAAAGAVVVTLFTFMFIVIGWLPVSAFLATQLLVLFGFFAFVAFIRKEGVR